MSIKENDRVHCVGDIFDGKVGTVRSVYNALGTAIVNFDEGVAKVPLSCLVKIKSQENAEIQEGAKRLAKDEYYTTLQYLTGPETISSKNPIGDITVNTAAMLVGVNVGKKIFNDQDTVIMTEDQFIAILWDGFSPANICETSGGVLSERESMGVSIATITRVRKLVDILFGGSDD
jgi:hypothetical protein